MARHLQILKVFSDSDFQYAIENTHVLIPPKGIIETFGSTTFRFILVSEFMDEVDRVRVRDGQIEAERPRLLSPHHFEKMFLEGFAEDTHGFSNWLRKQEADLRFLRYGFRFRKTDLSEEIIHEPLEEVIGRLTREFQEKRDPLFGLIEGIDDTWEVCLLKFTMDLIRQSAFDNMEEWKRRGFL